MVDTPIIDLGSLDKARLLGDQKLIVIDRQDYHYLVLVNYRADKTTVFLNPDSNVKLAWILRLLKKALVGKKGWHWKIILKTFESKVMKYSSFSMLDRQTYGTFQGDWWITYNQKLDKEPPKFTLFLFLIPLYQFWSRIHSEKPKLASKTRLTHRFSSQKSHVQ